MSEHELQVFAQALIRSVAVVVVASFAVGFLFGWISDVWKLAFSRVWARRELRAIREVRRLRRARQG